MRLRILWRIMEIGEGVICQGRHFLTEHKILLNLVIGNWTWWIECVLLANQNGGNILNE